MQTCNALSGALVVMLGMTAHAVAFDIKNLNADTPPAEALRYGIDSYRSGDKTTAVEALSFAAKNGNAGAQWKLASMYAEGDGVEKNDYQAFKLFSDVAAHADDADTGPPRPADTVRDQRVGEARLVLPQGHTEFRREGGPEPRARVFLATQPISATPTPSSISPRMFYNGEGGDRDLIQAAKWANLSADKGNPGGEGSARRDRSRTDPRPPRYGRRARQPAPGGAMGKAGVRLRQRRGAGALRPHPVRSGTATAGSRSTG